MENELWTRQEWDTDLTFRVFNIWLEMEKPRDLNAAWRIHSNNTALPHVRAPDYILQAYRGNTQDQRLGIYPAIGWEERVRGWDIEQKRQDMELWRERQNVLRKKEWEASEALLQRAMEMLDWPIYEEVYETGREVDEDGSVVAVHQTIRKPARWAIRDVQAMVKVASEVARLAAEMSQGKFEFHLSVDLSPKALEAIDILEKQGVKYPDVVNEFERIIIHTAEKYA
jgi:DNA primase large subunit